MSKKFYICNKCGNLMEEINGSGVPVVCCGEKMHELTANTVEASHEKHLPVVTVNGSEIEVKVGSAVHPMVEEHSILWIYLQTSKGGQLKSLKPGDAPEAKFTLIDDEAIAAYAYCNLHGLWKTEIK